MHNPLSITNNFWEKIEGLDYIWYYTIAAILARADLFGDDSAGTIEEYADRYMQELRKYPKDVVIATRDLISNLVLGVNHQN